MAAAEATRLHVTIHLLQQTTVGFDAADLWPLHGGYARFGGDLPFFAEK